MFRPHRIGLAITRFERLLTTNQESRPTPCRCATQRFSPKKGQFLPGVPATPSHHINGAFAADMMPEALAGPAVWHGLAAKARRSVVCRIFLLK
jgi:hypothetical protein